ncbi:MAG: hypothetical protein UHY90_10485 [Treponema sp.]|nr:hypothetical protein [Treponema sp.]
MKKLIMSVAAAVLATAAFAYNPPVGGEEPFRFSNPNMLSGSSSSAAGGPSFNVVPDSIIYNPALPAQSEIITVDLGGSILFNTDKEDGDKSKGYGFETGVIVPTSFAAFTGTFNYVNSEMWRMPLGKIWDIHFGASKDVLDWLSVGVNLYFRRYSGYDLDSENAFGADFGALARLGDVAFLKDLRLGASVLNCGKPADFKTLGMDNDDSCSKFPTIFTPRAAASATIFEAGKWVGGLSIDVAAPSMVQNFINDIAFEATYDQKLRLTAAWQFNLRESVEAESDGRSALSLGVSYKFGKKLGGKDSSITPALASQYLYDGIFALSTGAVVELGQKDTSGAEVEMW